MKYQTRVQIVRRGLTMQSEIYHPSDPTIEFTDDIVGTIDDHEVN